MWSLSASQGAGGSDLTDAYNVQRELASGKFADHIGPLVGWKCGATNAEAQFALQVDGPFLGPLFANSVVHLGIGVQWSVEHKILGAPSFKVELGFDNSSVVYIFWNVNMKMIFWATPRHDHRHQGSYEKDFLVASHKQQSSQANHLRSNAQ